MRAEDVPAEDVETYLEILTEDMNRLARRVAGLSTAAEAFESFVRQHREGLDGLEKRAAAMRIAADKARRAHADRVVVARKLRARRDARRAA